MIADFLSRDFFGNSVADYLAAAAVFCGLVIVLFWSRQVVLSRLERWAAGTETQFDDLLVSLARRAFFPLLFVGALTLSLRGLTLNKPIHSLLALLWTAVLTLFGIRAAISLTEYALRKRLAATDSGSLAVRAVLPILKILLWVLGLLFFLDNMGVKISAVVAGLGIGGVAVALAAQAVLADLFSYIAILFDRPFKLGDFIVVDDLKGTVENIGIKTTRVRSLSGELLVFPNSALTGSRIRNFQALEKRRVAFSLGVTYETPLDKLKALPSVIQEIIGSMPGAVFERAHFASYGDFALNFEVVYHVESPDYNRYMDIHQSVNFAIKSAFDGMGVSFAYPTKTVYNVSA